MLFTVNIANLYFPPPRKKKETDFQNYYIVIVKLFVITYKIPIKLREQFLIFCFYTM